MNRALLMSALVFLSLAAGCAGGARVAGTATDQQRAVLFDRVKSLEGTWVMKDEKGQEYIASVFKVSSSGSVVREIMFPGSDHEMTNVYHMDGPTLVMTHYCAGGNQPRMRAVAGDPNTINLKFDSVTNLRSSDEQYMGGLVITLVSADYVKADWTSYQRGKDELPHAVFEMHRQK
jgi:cyclopropane fatty-acyl-phospholipid synthase-like methyltransferase